MDICVYVHVNKIIRCEYNNRGGGGGMGGEWNYTNLGGACPKSLKTPVLMYTLTNEIILKDQNSISHDKWIRFAYKPPFPPCEQNCAKTESLPLQSNKLFTILYILAQISCDVNSSAESGQL